MKNQFLVLLTTCFSTALFSQAITFNGCHQLFDDQDFVFAYTGMDASGKKIYVTEPVTGDQPCGGLGTCELMILWNASQSRWEFVADSGNGNFDEPPFIIYYNDAASESSNPPAIGNGVWKENTDVTSGLCNGNMGLENSVFSGDLNSEGSLSAENPSAQKLQFYPNPVRDFLTVSGVKNVERYHIFDLVGRQVQQGFFQNKIDVSQLGKGVYLFRIQDNDGKQYQFKFIRN